ncbi:MAG: hypothetical protein ACYCW6_13435 [Candidatus Xenobia bacterium]
MRVGEIPGIPAPRAWRKPDVGATSPFGEDQVEIAATPRPAVMHSHVGWRAALALALTLGIGGCATGMAWAAPPEPAPTAVVAQVQRDFGPAQDVKAVKQAIKAHVGQAGNVSVSHDWALGRGYTEHTDASVVLHRVGGHWQVKQTDGGVYTVDLLQQMGVPAADAQNLVRLYQ